MIVVKSMSDRNFSLSTKMIGISDDSKTIPNSLFPCRIKIFNDLLILSSEKG